MDADGDDIVEIDEHVECQCGCGISQSDCTERRVTVLEMDPGGPKNGRSKICPFLYSNGHTEAKKISENFLPWYHLTCFFFK